MHIGAYVSYKIVALCHAFSFAFLFSFHYKNDIVLFYFIKALLDTGVCTYICFKFSVLVYSFRMRTKLSCVSTMECLYMYVVYIEIYNVHKLINERIVEVCTAHKNRIS